MKCLRAVNLSDSRRKGSVTGAGQGVAVAARGVAWRGGVVQSIYRHVHSLQVCAAVATPAGMADYVPPRVPASLLASSGSLAPTWPLTTSKSAKCQVFALVSSPATYIPCAAAPHTPFSPPPLPYLLPLLAALPVFVGVFCHQILALWHFLAPSLASTQRSQFQFPLMCFVVRCFLCSTVAACFSCRALVGYSFMHIDFRSVLFICRTSHGRTDGRWDRAGFAVCSCLFARRLFMCRNWSGSF